MSIYQPIKMPVSVFSSEDTDAPTLSASGAAGEIKTIIKACLITGYGSTAAQGSWEMKFEDGNKAVFRSNDPRSNRYFLRIDNSGVKSGDVACYASMSSVDTGDDKWFAASTGFAHTRGQALSWRLLATSASFILLVDNATGNTTPFFFGDVMTTVTNDSGNTIIVAPKNYNGGSAVNIDYLAKSGYTNSKIAKNYNASNVGVQITESTINADTTNAYTGHLAISLPLLESNIVRAMPPWKSSNKRESFRTKIESIGAHEYCIFSVGGAATVYMIPTDNWLL